MEGNWDMSIDIGIAILTYIHVSMHVSGKNPLACALNSSLFASVKTEGQLAKIKGREVLREKGVKGVAEKGKFDKLKLNKAYLKGVEKRQKSAKSYYSKKAPKNEGNKIRAEYNRTKMIALEANTTSYMDRKILMRTLWGG